MTAMLRSPLTQIRVGAAVAAFLLWELAASLGPLSDYLPHTWEIATAVRSIFLADAFGGHLQATLTALVVGLLIGATAGIVIGLVIASSRALRLVFEPLIVYLGAIPKIVIYPIFVWFLSIGVASKIGMSVLSTFFPVVVSTMGAAWVIRPGWPKAATMLGASPFQRLVHVALPAMAPSIVTGVRLGVSVGIVGTLSAETKVGNQGVGYLITHYYSRYELPEMYAVVLVVFLAASLIAVGLERLTRNIGGADRQRATQSAVL